MLSPKLTQSRKCASPKTVVLDITVNHSMGSHNPGIFPSRVRKMQHGDSLKKIKALKML